MHMLSILIKAFLSERQFMYKTTVPQRTSYTLSHGTQELLNNLRIWYKYSSCSRE